jgi:MFS family permease
MLHGGRGPANPFALGGLVGSLLFAGYMLTQFPGGYVGDRLGHRTVIVIAIVWAGIATLLSGVMTALIGFVALRVITGLGAGLFYSNDRTVIASQTRFEKRSLGMGVVITALAIGITLALLLAGPLIDFGVAATEAGLAEWVVALLELALALGLVGFIFFRLSGDVGPVLMNRDL